MADPDKYLKTSNLIFENYRGREVVFMGFTSIDLEVQLRQVFGIEVDHCVRTDEGYYTRDYSSLEKDQVYIVEFTTCPDKDDLESRILEDREIDKDYCFVIQDYNLVKPGTKDYKDADGNEINDCPRNCKVIFRGKNSKITIQQPIIIHTFLIIEVGDNVNVEINKDSMFGGVSLQLLGSNSSIKIDEKVYINKLFSEQFMNSSVVINSQTTISNLQIRAFRETNINIGKDCLINEGVMVLAGDGHAIFNVTTLGRTNDPEKIGEEKNKITISNHTWLAINSTILGGTSIGAGSIVAAGCIAKGKFPNNCVIAGIPGQVVKKDIAWSRQDIGAHYNSINEAYFMPTI